MVIQRTSKNNHFQISAYHHSLSKIKHKCRLHIDKLVGHINLVLSSDFEFHVSEDEEEENEEIPDMISRILGHLSCQSCKYKYQKIVQKMEFTYKRLA